MAGPSGDAHDAPRDERFRRADRILRRRDYLRVQQGGKRVHAPHFVMIVLPAPRPRLGITVTKRVASAVGRNRIKRCVREVYRRNRELFPDDCELVVVARRGAATLGYEAVRAEIAAASPALQRAARSAHAQQQRRPDQTSDRPDGREGER